MKKIAIYLSLLISFLLKSQIADVVPLGIYGGEKDNLSSYLVSVFG
jgi:hypothetical protein